MPALKPKRKSDYNSRLLPDGYVLIHSEKSTWVHTLTPLGGLVWEYCDGANTAEEIANLIGSQPEVSAKQEDVLSLVKEFEEKGLLDSSDN